MYYMYKIFSLCSLLDSEYCLLYTTINTLYGPICLVMSMSLDILYLSTYFVTNTT